MEPIVGQPLLPNYQLGIIVLSYVISFFGSLMALQCAKSMYRSDGVLNRRLLICAAVALGGIGIWSSHFIGMLAYRLEVPIGFDLILTLISLLAAIVISGIALHLANRGGRFRILGWLAGSLLAGLGACYMHYMGVYAMNLRATMSLDPGTVAISVAIAMAAAAAALWLAFNVTRLSHRIAAASIMGLAVCAMHHVGMTAISMICTAEAPAVSLRLGGNYLAPAVVFVSSAVLLYMLWIISDFVQSDGLEVGVRPT
jgi:NO-binding membrane sensor protein with MHYT domain